MRVEPFIAGDTWIEGEEMCSDYGQFRRRGLVRHRDTKKLVRVRLDIPDTYFSIPATTTSQHGYVTQSEGSLEFCPHTEQNQTPAEYRRSVRQSYR